MRRMLALVVSAVLLSGPLLAQEERTITVMGQGEVTASPDMAIVRLGVTTNAGTAREALASNSAAMEEVIARLAELGVEDRDLQTSTLDLGPRYDEGTRGEPIAAGFTARNVLTVRVRELDRLGRILDAVAGDGANTFEGLTFGMIDPQPLNDEALRRAVADARREAEILAREAGVALGEVVTIDAAADTYPRPMDMAMSRMAAESVPVASGELEMVATARVVFAIGE